MMVFTDCVQFFCCCFQKIRYYQYIFIRNITTGDFDGQLPIATNGLNDFVSDNQPLLPRRYSCIVSVLGSCNWTNDGNLYLIPLCEAIRKTSLSQKMFSINLIRHCVHNLPITQEYETAWNIISEMCFRVCNNGRGSYENQQMSDTMCVLYRRIENMITVIPSVNLAIDTELKVSKNSFAYQRKETVESEIWNQFYKHITNSIKIVVNQERQMNPVLWNIFESLIIAYQTLETFIMIPLLQRQRLPLRSQLLWIASPKFDMFVAVVDSDTIPNVFGQPKDILKHLTTLHELKKTDIIIRCVYSYIL